MTLSASNPQSTPAQAAMKALIVPAWMARTLAQQLRAYSPRGGITALANLPPPQFNFQAAQSAAAFR